MTGTFFEIRHEILRVEWTVHDFLSWQPESVGKFLDSPRFRLSDVSWCLRLYPYGDVEDEDCIELYLRRDDSSSSSVVICTLAVKKTDGSLHSKRILTWKFQDQKSYGCSRMLLRSDVLRKKDEFLREGALTFCCVLRKMPPTEVTDSLSLDLKKLRVSSAQSDVTVKLKSREYRAHRAVLAARSDAFASALTHDSSKKETGIITVEDCDSDSFGELLQYLYTGRADINEGNVFHLYRTAHKYLVGQLKSICVAFVMENLSVDNVCKAIAMADYHNDEHLANFCKQFFCDNAGSILVTSDWLSLMGSHRIAAAELLKLIAPKLAVRE